MRELLERLKEIIDFDESNIQFRIGEQFYELYKNQKGEWKLYVLFGFDLDLDTNELTGLDREEVEKILKKKIKNIEIY